MAALKAQPCQKVTLITGRRQQQHGNHAKPRSHSGANQCAQRIATHKSTRDIAVLRADQTQNPNDLFVGRERRRGGQGDDNPRQCGDQHHRHVSEHSKAVCCAHQRLAPAVMIVKHSPRRFTGQTRAQALCIHPVFILDQLNQSRNGQTVKRQVRAEPRF